jgi:hypothetical protein
MAHPNEHECGPACEAAAEITIWQAIAQQLPLPELMEMADDSRNGLAHSLNNLNDICQDTWPDPDVLARAVTEVARRATAAAIFTLGLCQRRHQEAALN